MVDRATGVPTSARWRRVLDTVASVAVVVAAAAVMLRFALQRPPKGAATSRDGPVPSAPVSLTGATLKGSPEAKVALIEYTDFQCPYSGRFAAQTLPALEESYVNTGKVLIALRHLPLPMHALAPKAAEAVECAGTQGKFWAMHDLLFADPSRLSEADFVRRAELLALDIGEFQRCLGQGQFSDKIRQDVESAKADKVTSTPTFFLGSVTADGQVSVLRRIRGAQPTRVFVETIEDVLKRVNR